MLVLFVAVIVVVAIGNSKTSQEDKEEQEAIWAATREREEKLLPQLARDGENPSRWLALCGHLPPSSLRFQKTENPLWVVPNCGYLKTEK